MSKKAENNKGKKPKRPSSGYVFTEDIPSWLIWITPEKFNDADLFRIITFYVFHSPCKGLSSQYKPIEDYGWTKPWGKPEYLNRKLKDVANNPKLQSVNIIVCKK